MKQTLLFIVALLLLALSFSAASSHHDADEDSYDKYAPEPCTIPKVWSTELVLYIGPGSDCPYNNTMVFGSVAYDYIHQMVRFDVLKGGSGPHSSWAFYSKKGVEWYYFDREAGTCESGTYDGSMIDISLKKLGTFKGQFTVGTQLMEAWAIKKANSMITVTSPQCYPTRAVGYCPKKGLTYSIDFMNLMPTIAPFSFDLPTECKKSTNNNIGNTHGGIFQHELASLYRILINAIGGDHRGFLFDL